MEFRAKIHRREATAGSGSAWTSSLPLGSSQHQKIVVIDNAVAFVGGLDLTIRRWDTSEHLAEHPLRRDPDGKPYPPFHDVQCMVEGEAAAALGEIAAARWAAAGCTVEGCEPVKGDRWPASVPAGARQIPAAIARTELRTAVQPGIRRSGAAVRGIDQHGKPISSISRTSSSAPPRSQRCWRGGWPSVPSLRVLIVTPKAHGSWLKSQAMQARPRRLQWPVRGGRGHRPVANSLSVD